MDRETERRLAELMDRVEHLEQLAAGELRREASAGVAGLLRAFDFGQLNKTPSCVVYHSVNQAIANATLTRLAFDSEVFDTNGFHSTVVNNGRLTIPAGLDGLYVATLVVFWDNLPANTDHFVLVDDQGGNFYGIDRKANGGVLVDAWQTIVTVPRRMVAGDYFHTLVYQAGGGPLNVGGGQFFSRFALCRLGGY
jgi:hypothetical protein